MVHGTLWLLDRMVGARVVTSAEAAEGLKEMMNAGRRLPDDEVAERLARWVEDGT